jgi:hypothetical protein
MKEVTLIFLGLLMTPFYLPGLIWGFIFRSFKEGFRTGYDSPKTVYNFFNPPYDEFESEFFKHEIVVKVWHDGICDKGEKIASSPSEVISNVYLYYKDFPSEQQILERLQINGFTGIKHFEICSD